MYQSNFGVTNNLFSHVISKIHHLYSVSVAYVTQRANTAISYHSNNVGFTIRRKKNSNNVCSTRSTAKTLPHPFQYKATNVEANRNCAKSKGECKYCSKKSCSKKSRYQWDQRNCSNKIRCYTMQHQLVSKQRISKALKFPMPSM